MKAELTQSDVEKLQKSAGDTTKTVGNLQKSVWVVGKYVNKVKEILDDNKANFKNAGATYEMMARSL